LEVQHNQQIFNCLVAQFTFALRNDPETSIKGHYPTQGGIEYLFKTYGAVAVLFIKMKHSMKSNEECLKAIAQIIAECSGKLQHFRLTLTAPNLLDVQFLT
jgi:hypothetical protein